MQCNNGPSLWTLYGLHWSGLSPNSLTGHLLWNISLPKKQPVGPKKVPHIINIDLQIAGSHCGFPLLELNAKT